MTFEYKISGGDFNSAGNAASALKKVLRQLGIDPLLIRRAVVALYEGEINIVAHAFHGIITVDVDENKVIMILEDQGPGIKDISKAMEAGYSTASPKIRELGFGAGMGLPNMKNNTDVFKIESLQGTGTRVKMINYFTNEDS